MVGSSIVGAALLPVSVFAADKGMVLALSCASCHGTDGASPDAIPRIKGRSAEYIEKAMLQFKAGERPATVMNRIAKGYTDEEIKLLSAYLGNQSASE